jgi:hypothetical protein
VQILCSEAGSRAWRSRYLPLFADQEKWQASRKCGELL